MNAYKKTITIGLTILISICSLCGCGQETEVLYDPNTSGEETSSVTSLSSEDTLTEKSEMSKEPAETEPISYLRESAQEYLNMASENGGTINDGGLMCFWDAASESDEPLERNEYNLPVEDGILELELNVLAFTMKQLHVELRLQLSYLLRQRTLRHVRQSCGLGETLCLGGVYKIAQLSDFHACKVTIFYQI